MVVGFSGDVSSVVVVVVVGAVVLVANEDLFSADLLARTLSFLSSLVSC